MLKKPKVRYSKKFRDTIFYRFPAMGLRDTLIFVGVCIAGGFVFDGKIEIAFGVVSIIMIAHFVVYLIMSKHYEAIEKYNKEMEAEVDRHEIKET